ncbi:ATP-dependent RNA helicase-like protein dbp9 [Xylogone sp. PMI_703]|nr:ATP-dependent RNA helicase-like protein dbp9 [Xylogone sp. PMI_703]
MATLRDRDKPRLRKVIFIESDATLWKQHHYTPLSTMKRKLDSNDVPAPVEVSDSSASKKEDATFSDLGLNPLLLQAVTKQNFKSPTLVQIEAIPLALAGRDLLVRAKTGSGKTAAYLLPILHSILKTKQNSSTQHVSSLILVPTRELAQQVFEAVESFSAFCAKDIRAVNLTQKVSPEVQRSILSDAPDIVVATPARAALNLNTGALSLDNLAHLVIDEADLVLSYGYDDDLKNVSKSLPKNCQNFLVSATLTEEVETLKHLFCRDPAVLKLEEPEEEGEGVTQYVVKCAEDEKFLLLYVIFKLKLIKGKCIIFVADIDRCYRLKLFLEQFGIRSCILNSELPVNSRIHVVEEFNKNVYDIIIASDEHEVLGDEEDSKSELATENSEEAGAEADARQSTRKKQKRTKRDKEYGVSRGIDFKNVACVLNFDLPTSSKSYSHRIGRTARAGKTGMAISFVIPSHEYRKHKPTSIPSTEHDEKVLSKIQRHQSKAGKEIKPYNFDMKQIEAFRYRMGDALRAVTKIAVREARSREVREELIKSEKLKRHFEENPDDLKHLRHDSELRPARVQSHLKHIPDYLLPKDGRKAITNGDVGFVSLRKTTDNRIRKARMAKRGKRFGGRKADPLKTFKARSSK